MEIAESEVPLEFTLKTMEEVFKSKGENIRGFGYYSTVIRDAWKNSTTPIIDQKRTSIPTPAKKEYVDKEVPIYLGRSSGEDDN